MRATWEQLLGRIASDTLAFFGYKLVAGTFSLPISLFVDTMIVDFTLWGWAGVRVVFNILHIAGAYFCGSITNALREKISGASERGFMRAFAEGSALSIYQIPIYAIVAFSFGGDLAGIWQACVIYLAINYILGWCYGIFLDWCRR